MAIVIYFWLIIVTIATVIYLNYPVPDFSDRLTTWLNKGKFHQYKSYQIFYIEEKGDKPDGDVILCIHGFPTSSYDWIKVLDNLKRQFKTIILPDMLGYGFSDKPKDSKYLITEQADILESLVTSLGISEIHVLSHDYGDTVALELLHRHNSNIGKVHLKSLCMLNGGVFPETNFPRLGQKLLLMPFLGDLFSRLSFYGSFKKSFSDVFGPQTKPSEEDHQDFYAAIRHKDGNVVFSRLIGYITQRGQNKERWVGALQKATNPVHMIYGPADPVNPPVFVDHYKKTVPSPSIDVLHKQIGHYPQWEAPEQVVQSYFKFLKRIKV